MSESKTGLTVSCVSRSKRNQSKRLKPFDLNLSKCSIVRPVQFALRPFGGLYNPYSSSCSILCNHPGPNEVKTVLKQVKEQYIEAKNCHFRDERTTPHDDYETMHVDPDHIPDEFYQRFTGSDSRPLTPTPTVASQRTRGSVGSQKVFHTRRCLTPDPLNSSCIGERKQIILDLRRSHSQETLFWNASSELSVPPSTTTATQKVPAPSIGAVPPKNMRLCEQEAARKRSAELKKAQELEATTQPPTTIVCIHDRTADGNDADDDVDGSKRRGKKKRKSKLATTNTFHVSQEPETLIATLGPDSPNQSARPSLVPTAAHTTTAPANNIDDASKNGNYLQSSFITEEALRLLRRGLNIDIVENAFERFMNRALKEALRTIPIDHIGAESTALRAFKETIGIDDATVDNEKWLTMPRKYTRTSARFSLPMNTNDLARLTPFTYLSRHVWISNHRKQLYRFVFNKYKCDATAQSTAAPENDANMDDTRSQLFETPSDDSLKMPEFVDVKECTMNAHRLNDALIDVLGFPVDEISNRLDEMHNVLDLSHENDFNYMTFRNWCGIVAFAERYLNSVPTDIDPCDEVEIADFESLERRLAHVHTSDKLKFILNFIKYNSSSGKGNGDGGRTTTDYVSSSNSGVAMQQQQQQQQQHKNDNEINCRENDTKIIRVAAAAAAVTDC